MRIIIVACAVTLSSVAPAMAQQSTKRFYVAPTIGVDFGRRGEIPGGAVPSAGGMFGVRIGGGWSVEAEVDRGFWKTSRSEESFWISFPPTGSQPDFERYGIKARFDREEEARTGWAVFAVRRTRAPGRLNVAVFGGLSARIYIQRMLRTPTFVSPEITRPEREWAWAREPLRMRHALTAAGYTGGVMVLA